jgi:hypothetical protein
MTIVKKKKHGSPSNRVGKGELGEAARLLKEKRWKEMLKKNHASINFDW